MNSTNQKDFLNANLQFCILDYQTYKEKWQATKPRKGSVFYSNRFMIWDNFNKKHITK